MRAAAKKKTEGREIDAGNPYIDRTELPFSSATIYEQTFKPILDKSLAFAGLVILSPIFAAISIAIFIDDPGAVFFTQKRVGKDKRFFCLHKFRSMKMSTPHDVPTHQLSDPEQYITRVGRVLRKTSLDELPQIWDIFRGKMSIIGPRPALWNQEDLVTERDKYGANGVLPGLTGWAQINGRDELEIFQKAKLDGEYVRHLKQGGIKALFFDVRCFLGTIKSVLDSDGIVEGGTGKLHKSAGVKDGVIREFEDYGYKKEFCIDRTLCKRILIIGANSYIGESFESYARKYYGGNFLIDTVDTMDNSWREADFGSYDTVFHVAGIAHADVGNVDEATKQKYYAVNTDLAIEAARRARDAGVRQFVFMSSMIVYGEALPFGKEKMIDEHTVPAPANFYGDSKWQADRGVRQLQDENFCVAVLRPPMIYGPGSKGNYPTLAKLAKNLPVFPAVKNQRSMLYIDNLCEFLCLLMLSGEGGIYFPQNEEYTSTSEMAEHIADAVWHPIRVTRLFNPAVAVASRIPGKAGGLVNKAFGNSTYARKLSVYKGMDYCVKDLRTSIVETEA
ncbi:sugar transferase [Candidatus Merdisoma sp. JLR.KK006]|uniref:sugar transferase n=1 Tax=Candidatus Merdisoma sp. JLR.KK006 TaxID=3112626 RepID=UPI002FF0A2AF